MVLDLHPHWWFFGAPLLWVVASGFGGLVVLSRTDGTVRTLLSYVVLAAIIVWSAILVVKLVKWRTTYFVVTSQRLIYRQGVVARDGVEIPLDRVNNVNFSQSILERLLGVGDLLVESGGQDGQQSFSDVAQPEKVQNIIHSTIRDLRAAQSPHGGPLSGIAHELERLEALRDRGTLTDDEFEAQKRRLLG
ncbi:MAG: hypothetical protein RLY50_1050 [Actinomycetota bacterium]|jgi:uncharacterized membrane protein YdbT with pleckstrin-like domain